MRILVVGSLGYIGSETFLQLTQDFSVTGIDIRDGTSYQSLSREMVATFDSVIWLAGHSSVKSSEEDPIGALKNNLSDLYEFALKIPQNSKFICASSASVYGNSAPNISEETDNLPPSINIYDRTKKWFEELIPDLHSQPYMLRFGTVSGWSPRMRRDLIVNAMTLDALDSGVVKVRNGSRYRSVLGIGDLISAIRTILLEDVPSGTYNVASQSGSIDEIGSRVAAKLGAQVSRSGESDSGSGGYSFRLSTQKLESLTSWRPTLTIEDIVSSIKDRV